MTNPIFRKPPYWRRTLIALMAIFMTGVTISPQKSHSESAPSPNIMLIMADDLDEATLAAFVASGYGPNIKKYFIQEGLRFTNSFVTDPVCCPSRATELTGQYTHNHGVLNVGTGIQYAMDANGQPVLEKSTRSTWLKGKYYTGHVGKYLNGYGLFTERTYVPDGYDKWYGLLDPGTYRVYEYKINENGTVKSYGRLPSDYQTDVLKGKVKDFLAAHKTEGAGKPFFLAFTPLTPHVEALVTDFVRNAVTGYSSHFKESIRPAPRHLKLADGILVNGEMPGPTSVNKPSFNVAPDPGKIQMQREIPLLTDQDKSNMTKQWKERLASMVSLDEAIGEIFTELQVTGRFENTVVFLTGDNGYFFGEHRQSSKLWPYEESIRVPLYVRGPGIPGGVSSQAMVLNNDLAPTYAELAGVTPTHVPDGRSIVPLLRSPNAAWPRNNVLIQLYEETSLFGDSVLFGDGVLAELWTDIMVPAYKGLRCKNQSADEVYVRWHENQRTPDITDPTQLGAVTTKEYYDLKVDPHQLKNAASALSAPKQGELDRKLDSLQACKGAACRQAEDGL